MSLDRSRHTARRKQRHAMSSAGLALATLSLLKPYTAVSQDTAESLLEEITVTGTRIATSSGFSAPTPVTVLGSEQMEKLGTGSVGEALNFIPSFNPSTTPSTQGFGGIGATFADLRGLGANRNLVLVNGRRVVPTNVSGNVDLNLIPSMMVQRSEVVTGGASAAYGSDAVAGVTNIMLDTTLQGVRSQVEYGMSEHEDNETFLASIAGGTSFHNGRGHVVAGFEYSDSKGVGDEFERPWGWREVMRIPNIGVPGQPFNILTTDVHNANASIGGYIRNTRTATGTNVAPALDPLRGQSFNPDGTTSPWIPGEYSIASPFQVGGSGHGENVYLRGGIRLVSPLERHSTYVHVDYELAPDLTWFAEGTYAAASSLNPAGQFRAEAYTISIDNPFIPAAVRQVLVDGGYGGFVLGRNGTDLGTAMTDNERDTMRFATGLEGRLSENWTWDAYYQFGRTHSENRVHNNRIGKTATSDPSINNFAMAVDAVTGPGGVPMCRVVADALIAGTPLQAGDPGYGCSPLNLFGANNFSPESKAFAYGTSSQDTTLLQHVVAANLSGELAQLWAGPLAIATGAEIRRDKAEAEADPISKRDGWFVGVGQDVNARINVMEAYVEGALPLLDGDQRLDLNAAYRYARYDVNGYNFSTSGAAPEASDSSFSAKTWKLGLTYEPLDSVRLRVTRSRDIRAPNINELFGARVRGFASTTDHGRGETVPLQLTLGGGNPGLQPEVADTWTAGVILQPSWAGGLRMAIDYYRIEIDEAIGTVGSQNIMDRCYLGNAPEMCTLIVRLPPGPGESVGPIAYIENTLQNINQFKTSGIDLEVDYTLPLGNSDLNLRLLGNYVFDYISVDSAGAVDRAGQTGFPVGGSPGVPDLTLDGFVSWNLGRLTTTLHARYINSGINNAAHIGPDDSRYAQIVAEGMANPLYTSTTNQNEVPGRTYLNLNGSYDLIDQATSGYSVQLYARIANLLDKDPPQMHTTVSTTNNRYFDVIGRSYKAGFRMRF